MVGGVVEVSKVLGESEEVGELLSELMGWWVSGWVCWAYLGEGEQVGG